MQAGRIAWSIVGLLSLCTAARAGPVTFQFAGEITRVRDPDNLLGGAVTIGSPFSGSYTFESATPDVDPDPRRGLYEGALLDVLGQVGALGYHGPRGERNAIEVRDGFAGQGLGDEFYQIRSDLVVGGLELDFGLGFGGVGGDVLGGDALPIIPPDITRFESREFYIFDSSENVPIGLGGEIKSLTLVPDSGTLLLLLVGMGLLGTRQPRRVLCGVVLGHVVTTTLFVGAFLLFDGAPAEGVDCNANGVDDSLEVGSCTVDLVFLVDTSSSMQDIIPQLICIDTIPIIKTQLTQRGVVLNAETLRIPSTPPTVPCSCCTDGVQALSVQALYGSSTSCLPESLGVCSTDEDNNEDWAPATAIVAGKKSWTPGAMRIIVPISDEGPRCGDFINDPGDDRDAVNHAIPIVRANHVIVVPLLPAVPGSSEYALARYALASVLAEGGARCGNVFSFNDAGLVDKIVELVLRHCPADCNANGTLDECDLSAATSADCHGKPNNCCTVHATSRCGNSTIEGPVCAVRPSCCNESWTIECVNEAELHGSCAVAIQGDCVPDECQPSRDCNDNRILDDCDLACGGPDSPCDVPGCGQGTDCNRDCILDECESADCNANGIVDLCDIAAGTPDVDMDSVPDECAACCLVDPYGGPLCENRTSAGCMNGTSYTLPGGGPGPTCGDDCTCGQAPCCCCGSAECNNPAIPGCDCQELPGCECAARGGYILGLPHRSGSIPFCYAAHCGTGACCHAGSCYDRVSGIPIQEGECTSLDDPFVGGAVCTDVDVCFGTPVFAGPSPGAIVWDCDPVSLDRTTRSLRFRVERNRNGSLKDAIRVESVELQHPDPRNAAATTALPTQTVPQNFSTFDTNSNQNPHLGNGICSRATATPNYNGHPCDPTKLLVNDGCPAVGPAESGAQCLNATDDDGDGKVNDGCPTGGAAPESGPQCDNNTDDDPADDARADCICNTQSCPNNDAAHNGVCVGNPTPPLVACTATNETVPANASGQGGCARWVGKPATFLEAHEQPTWGNYRAARLQCTPFYFDWVTETAGKICAGPLGPANSGLPCVDNSGCTAPATCIDKKITVVGAEILPSSTYNVQTYGASCRGNEGNCTNVSAPVTMLTRRHGDVASFFTPPDAGQPGPTDVSEILRALNKLGPLRMADAKISPNLPELNMDLDAGDLGRVLQAAQGYAYPPIESGPCPCPSAVTCNAKPCERITECTVCVGGSKDGELCTDDDNCQCCPGNCDNGQCGDGAVCGGSNSSKKFGTCVRTCTNGVNAGQPCWNNTHCPGGRSCSAGNIGAPCTNDDDCDVHGDCVWDPEAQTGRCTNKDCVDGVNIGLPCDSLADCPGSTCVGRTCIDFHVCFVPGSRAASPACGNIANQQKPGYCRDRCGRCK